MSNKLIFIPFAFDAKKRTGNNMSTSSIAHEIYCKNFCVALVSLKKYNPECDDALVTNCEISDFFKKILVDNNIIIHKCDFDSFVFPNDFPWSLAFYKLCALKYMVEEFDYQHYCYLDADIIANGSLDGVWLETEQNIILYDINHGFNVPNYRKFLESIELFLGKNKIVTQYGGEFFAANKANAQRYLAELLNVYNEIIQKKYEFKQGDEFLISLAADRLKMIIRNAGSYVFRFWTGQFRLVSTCYEYNFVSILHLPDEKNRGIVKIFDRYIANGKYPTQNRIYSICCLKRRRFKSYLKQILKI